MTSLLFFEQIWQRIQWFCKLHEPQNLTAITPLEDLTTCHGLWRDHRLQEYTHTYSCNDYLELATTHKIIPLLPDVPNNASAAAGSNTSIIRSLPLQLSLRSSSWPTATALCTLALLQLPLPLEYDATIYQLVDYCNINIQIITVTYD